MRICFQKGGDETHATAHKDRQNHKQINERLSLWITCHSTRDYQFAEQVIIQVWISTRFGVISERLAIADENLLFIGGTFTRRQSSVKGI